ncbi:hypothetical protein BDR26DRAFT_959175, partial [Obelidium mucronatum]
TNQQAPPLPPTSDFFAPVATATNIERCSVIRKIIMDTCREKQLVCYRIIAAPANDKNRTAIARISYLNDDSTDKIPLLLDFYLGMPLMITKQIPVLNHLKIFANGTLCFVLGFATQTMEHYITTVVDGVVVKQFTKTPAWLWVKVRNCTRILVPGCPAGVVAIPPLTLAVLIKMPNSAKLWSPRLTQFPVISALACTLEKLQGVTLEHWITISKLDRIHFKPQTLYVAFSRVRKLSSIRLISRLTLEYSRKFRPPRQAVAEMMRLIQLVCIPAYASQSV